MGKMIALYIILGIVGFAVLIFIIGLLLPDERIVSRQSVFPVTPEVLYSVVTNNENWKYRSGLKNLVIIEKDGEHEIWDEITKDGAVIRFSTKEKKPFTFYSFEMNSKMFSGYWTATFEPVNEREILFTATEYISVKNPFIKTLSYLFFDIGKLMDDYQNDLKNKIETQSTGTGN